MAIKFEKLFALLKKNNHSSTLWLRSNGMHAETVNRLKKNECVNADTINKLCCLLDCQPEDIMEYVEDEKDTK